jgi:hypothetical protein
LNIDYLKNPQPIYKNILTQIITGLDGSGLISYRDGVFIAFSEKTEKTNFLRDILVPKCLGVDWNPIYINLTENETDPIYAIRAAITLKINRNINRKKDLNTDSVKLKHYRELAKEFLPSELHSHMTLSCALEILYELTEKMTVLIVDEVVSALTTDDGMSSQLALKSARDVLGTQSNRLRMVYADTNHEKLSYLVRDSQQAFYCSSLIVVPS